MSLSALALALELCLTPSALFAAEQVAPEEWLLEQVRIGEASHRDDLVRQSLYRLELMAPQNPQVLSARMRLALREGNRALAQQQLDKIQQVAPDSALYRQAKLSLELTSTDKQKQLQQARLLGITGHLQEAKALYDQAFEGQPPPRELALEYWQLVARMPGQSAVAERQLQALNQHFPGDVKVRLQLAKMAFAEKQNARAIALVTELSYVDEGREPAADLWLSEIKSQPVSNQSVDALRHFGEVFTSGDSAIEAQQELQRQQALLADPRYQARVSGLQKVASGASTSAIAPLKKALQQTPNDADVLGALGQAYSRADNRQQALSFYQQAKKNDVNAAYGNKWDSLIKADSYWLEIEQGDKALKAQNLNLASQHYQRARQINSRDPWAWIGLGDIAVARHDDAQAEQAYLSALRVESNNSSAQRGLTNIYQRQSPQKALNYIKTLPAAQRAKLEDMQRGIENNQLAEQAERLASQQQWAAAAQSYQQLLKLDPDNVWATYHYANALRETGRNAEADAAFKPLVAKHPDDPQQVYAYALYLSGTDRDAAAVQHLNSLPQARWDSNMRELAQRITLDKTLNEIDQLIARGEKPQARDKLAASQLPVSSLSLNQQRRVAMAWHDVGEAAQAARLLQPVKTAARGLPVGQDKALIYRDSARLEQQAGQPDAAREDYQQAMLASGMTPQLPADNDSYTRLTRNQAGDDWLNRSIRADAHDLYRQQDVNFTLDQDMSTNSGTPGKSDLKASTTMLQADMPWYQGRAFLRSDIVRMDNGSFENTPIAESDPNQQPGYTTLFGSCGSGPKCDSDYGQRASGVSFGAGYKDQTWEGDLGTTPLGFPVVDWVGGLAYSSDWQDIGWTAMASRRPISSSMLSYAGAKDPKTGTTWGGVRATGVSLGVSYDQGKAHGLWGDISAHQLTGKNVADNSRERLMGGYYYKVINEDNRRATVGLNSMLWHYQKDLSGYTLGQGGYYSPQQYFSLAVPVNYRQRTDNWSWEVGGSVSWSRSSTKDQKRYPLTGLLPSDFKDKDAIEQGSSSSGFGYTAQALIERRVSSHWTVGAAIDIQQAKDYTPSHYLLYVRYSLAGWQGDLVMPPRPLVPYADFK
ncbi:cellulose synthase subunit BcsC-related outer membrane protein [Ewingella americana]